jgi:hypothetical protein
MEQISVTETAKRKNCSGQAVRDAIKKEQLDAVQIGRTWVVMTTRKFFEWSPNNKRQVAGKQNVAKRLEP